MDIDPICKPSIVSATDVRRIKVYFGNSVCSIARPLRVNFDSVFQIIRIRDQDNVIHMFPLANVLKIEVFPMIERMK